MQAITRKEGQRLIDQWKAAWETLKKSDNHDDSQAAMWAIMQCSIKLGEAGYRTNDDETDWYHPSDHN